MTTILLSTKISAPIQKVFDLSRDIDVHQNSASKTNEIAIEGTTHGKINLNETVTWRGKHFGLYLKHTSLITQMEMYTFFADEMIKGHFKTFRYEHYFEEKNGVTTMTDKLMYETPFWIFGQLFDYFCLEKHLTNFLLERNQVLKSLLES